MPATLVRRFFPRNATQIVDHRTMDVGTETIDRGLAVVPTPSIAPRLADRGTGHGATCARR